MRQIADHIVGSRRSFAGSPVIDEEIKALNWKLGMGRLNARLRA